MNLAWMFCSGEGDQACFSDHTIQVRKRGWGRRRVKVTYAHGNKIYSICLLTHDLKLSKRQENNVLICFYVGFFGFLVVFFWVFFATLILNYYFQIEIYQYVTLLLYLEITYFYYCWKRSFDWAFILWGNTFYFCCRFCMQRTNRVYNYAVFYYHVRRHLKKYHIFFCCVVFGTLMFFVVVF